jgi:hypothetical protein
MRVVKIIFGVLCFGIGVAFAVGTVADLLRLLHPNPYSYDDPAWLLGMLAAMFLLGSYLLLRGSFSSSRNEAEMEKRMKAMLDEWKERDRAS